MRISDWSSDVCSSDLPVQRGKGDADRKPGQQPQAGFTQIKPCPRAPQQKQRDKNAAAGSGLFFPFDHALLWHGRVAHPSLQPQFGAIRRTAAIFLPLDAESSKTVPMPPPRAAAVAPMLYGFCLGPPD